MAIATNLTRIARRALLALVLTPALAFGAGLELSTAAFKEVEVVSADGRKEKVLQAVDRAVPGDEIVYVTTYRNAGDKPAAKVVLKNPMPAGLVFKAGSAQGAGARAEVSVDGGTTWGVLAMLSVKGADGKSRPATPEDVTHVRWTLAAPVAPGAEGTVTYRGLLK